MVSRFSLELDFIAFLIFYVVINLTFNHIINCAKNLICSYTMYCILFHMFSYNILYRTYKGMF